MNFRQGLYQEAVYISCKRHVENSTDVIDQSSVGSSKQEQSKSLSQNEINLETSATRPLPSLTRSTSSRKLLSADSVSDRAGHCSTRTVNGTQALKKRNSSSPLLEEDRQGKENRTCMNSSKNKQSPDKKSPRVITPVKKSPIKHEPVEKFRDPLKLQVSISNKQLSVKIRFEHFYSKINYRHQLSS